MNCQHCQAELTSKRAKQCPACSALKTEAHKRGTYGEVVEAMSEATRMGLTGEVFNAYMTEQTAAAVKSMHQAKDQARADWQERQRIWREGRSACSCCGQFNHNHTDWCEFGIAG